MKAIQLTGIRRLEVAEVAKPVADKNTALIKVSACGICGSDLKYWKLGSGLGGLPNIIMGHEMMGVIEDPGGYQGLTTADRVTAIPINSCDECAPCKKGLLNLCVNNTKRPQMGQTGQGAYAEYIAVRADMVRRLPDSIDELSAAMIEPAAVALHAVKEAGVQRGDRVMVVGGGTIGLLCAAWARIYGASYVVITEANKNRGDLAREIADADQVLEAGDPKLNSKIKKATEGGADVVIETSAADAGIHSALLAVRPKGTVALLGISFKPQSLATLVAVVKEIAIKPVYAYLPGDFDLVIDAMRRGVLKVNRFVSRTVGLHEVQAAFENLSSGTSAEVKIVVRM
jgi:2-desacetyl-2-hydroxyethyl bacteriochlorophyllide A dehydrogenase